MQGSNNTEDEIYPEFMENESDDELWEDVNSSDENNADDDLLISESLEGTSTMG